MNIKINGSLLEELIESGDLDEISCAFGHMANALEELGAFPEDHL